MGLFDRIIKNVVKDTGVTVIVPDYPLSPQYKYTDVFNMIEPLYKEITKKVQKENLIIMGGNINIDTVSKAISGTNISIEGGKTIIKSPYAKHQAVPQDLYLVLIVQPPPLLVKFSVQAGILMVLLFVFNP